MVTKCLLTPACACLVAQSRPTLCKPMDLSPLGSTVPMDSPGKKTGLIAMPSSNPLNMKH